MTVSEPNRSARSEPCDLSSSARRACTPERRTSTRRVAPPGARLVFAAGACPLNDAGEVVAPGRLRAPGARGGREPAVALEAAGSGFEQVLKTTVYVASSDRAQLVRVWRVVEESFAPARPPSTLLGVAVLGYPGQLVEIEAVALASG